MDKNVKKYLDENFEKIKQLHKSEKSEIWLVYHLIDRQTYVLKYLKQSGLSYKTLKNFHHKILPKILYVSEDDSSTIVIEEYVNGKTLANYCNERNFIDENLLAEILVQLCAGLALLHKNHIIHRDIKPSNLILTNDKLIKLIDFDAARIEKNDQKNDTIYLGTKGYAPPEQYGFGQTDARSDIYALGVTIKKLLGSSYQGKFLSIVDKCTKMSPDERFQSVMALCDSVKNIDLLIWKSENNFQMQTKLAFTLPSITQYAFDKNTYSVPVLSSPKEQRYDYTSYKQAIKEGFAEFRDRVYAQKIPIIRKVVIAYKCNKLMNFLKYEECDGNYKFEMNKKLEHQLRIYATKIEAYIGKPLDLKESFFEINTRDSIILKDRLRYGIDSGWAERIASKLEPADWFYSWIDSDDTTISVEKKRWFSNDVYHETKNMYCFVIGEAVKKMNDQILDECRNHIVEFAKQEITWELGEYHRLLQDEWDQKIKVLLEKYPSD